MKYKRIFVVVADSVGCGYTEESKKYNDEGANTIAHIASACNGINLPTLEQLGYGNITNIQGVSEVNNPKGFYGKCDELSVGKDTMTGHFEMMGLEVTQPFMTFTDTGFPKELIDKLEHETGYKVIGNKAASGTEILVELGEEHLKTKAMIVYTSADSVLQIACHEEVFGLEELYRCCHIAREICMDPRWMVGRIIARPFLGTNKDNFKRTPHRHDYALSPHNKTVLDYLKESNHDVVAIGKINDIFNTCGITETQSTISNHDGMLKTIEIAKNKNFNGLCFVNLVDFDALYGHRRDALGYKECLEEFDNDINNLINFLNNDDLLIITADHGNDPTWHGTDHTREFVPLMVYNNLLNGSNLGTRKTFADIGATISENFNITKPSIGTSFLKDLK